MCWWAFIFARMTPDRVASAKVWNVRIDVPVIVPYIGNPHLVQATTKEVMGSRLEIVDVADGMRKVIHEAPGRLRSA